MNQEKDNNNITVHDFALQMRQELASIYGSGEAKALVALIFHAVMGWSYNNMLIYEDRVLSTETMKRMRKIVERVVSGEPIQYVLGQGRFYGMDLKVSPAVLIPRQETEEMVDLIISEYRDRSDLHILDVGTGSGAIAIALARHLRFPVVAALDISDEALAIARQNAEMLHAQIDFIHQDIFSYMPKEESLDLMVSNPPYIAEHERSAMERNVLEYEPARALFVPDAEPLIFYSRIAELGQIGLKPGGRLWFEINPLYADDLVNLLKHSGYSDVELHRDISHRNRFASCTR
ncbi:MAG: peptide chain release factor N(5)-glutamine methyltransferase [Muribaculaceae bacterium]|nr:peptide chain release factor N(5)-glutamine methyltransferase [Muribaculaceae bacterium]